MAENNKAQQLLRLHTRLLDGDRIASEEVVGLLLIRLSNELARKFPNTDKHLISDGVTDALLEYCTVPKKFDPSRGVPLDRFLSRAAWRNVANSVRGEKRRKLRESKALTPVRDEDEELVELDVTAGNMLQDQEKDRQHQAAQLLRMVENPVDKKILELRLTGERRTEEFARIMNIYHLPKESQQREVKRAKDRIDKFLQRSRKGVE
jgi:RNA polymerase sigma-70 factor (ECF subfamily)